MAEIDVLGVLASDLDVQNRNLSERVFVNSMNALQYMVKPISELPEQWDKGLYTGYWQNGKYDFEDNDYTDVFSRKAAFTEWFKDRLVVFKPIYRSGYYKMEDIRIVPKPNRYTEKSTYTAIPVFSNKIHGISKADFEDRLMTEKFIGRIDNISHEDKIVPEFVIWKDNEDEYWVYGPIDGYRYAHGGFSFQAKNLREGVNFKEEWFEDLISIPNTENVMFIGVETQKNIIAAIEEAAKMKECAISSVVLEKVSNEEKPREIDPEIEFIDTFVDETKKKGFVYAEKDLVNFHTAMKSSNLVILSGMSGTGKSRLVEFYRKALGIPDERATIIPVRSSWSDDADLIGYVDLLHMVYRPGDSGLVNTLLQASRDRDQLFIVCFDEMNLARVEHYFSQFLSLLEMDINRRYLKLYNEDLEVKLYNAKQYPSTIKIGENVLFVGTVNMDESTYHFSDKVLDRANVISLTVRSFSELKDLKGKNKEDEKGDVLTKSFASYQEFKNKNAAILLTDDEIELLKELHSELHFVNRNIGVGFRILNQIDTYLKNLPQVECFSREDAFDKQVVQRVLTKLRGSEDQLKGLLGRYMEETGEVVDSKLLSLFDKYKDVSDFKETKKIICYKAKELKLHGYTM